MFLFGDHLYLTPQATQVYLLFKLQINGLVMVDMNKYYAGIDSTRPDVSWLQPAKSWITDCSCFVCRRRNKERSQAKAEGEPFEDYHGIYPKDNKSLTPHQYFLLPPKIWAFIFKTRTWGT